MSRFWDFLLGPPVDRPKPAPEEAPGPDVCPRTPMKGTYARAGKTVLVSWEFHSEQEAEVVLAHFTLGRTMTIRSEPLRRGLLALAFALLAASPAIAHQAPSGWEYGLECCSSADCHPVPDRSIREVPGGWNVIIMPGEHPMVPRGSPLVAERIEHGDRRIHTSGDGEKHACVFMGRVRCIYVDAPGS